MSVLQPQIVRIGIRRYRKNPFTLSFQEPEAVYEPYVEETEDMYIESKAKSSKQCEYEDEACNLDMKKCTIKEEEDFKDIEFKNGFYKHEMRVAESYFGFIIGRNGEKKSNLERDTQTSIRIPRRGQGDLITIEGNDPQSVASCRNRLILLIITARLQKPFTHLLTFPLKFEQFKQKFKEFQDQVLKVCHSDRGVDETIFQAPNKLHLTICTLTLLSDFEVDEAVNLLDECRKDFVNSKELKVRIKGLEYMNDDPSEVDVLYAKIAPLNEASLLEKLASKLMLKFVEAGWSKKQFDRVKIHATVMNSLHRQDQNTDNQGREGNGKIAKQRESFDARNILKQFGEFDFGVYTLNEIHLSLRYSTGPDGYYECISKINI